MKRIIICSDGTWNRPERLGHNEDFPTNVLKFARGISSKDKNDIKQIVFYDWGIGSYHNTTTGGAFGAGLEKNVMDAYRFLVHNYDIGDEIYTFGFSRGAYTVRSLCGMINNSGILKSSNGSLVEKAFDLYKDKNIKPNSNFMISWRKENSIENISKIKFVGVWDTVGALGLPFSVFGLIEDKHLFYDNKIGSNIETARHALSLDEERKDFEATIWKHKKGVDLKQVWFSGVHADIGGSYAPTSGSLLSDIPMMWMKKEAEKIGLFFENFINVDDLNPIAKQHNEYKRMFKVLGKKIRTIPKKDKIPTSVHISVKERYENSEYKSQPIENYIKENNIWPDIEV